MQVRTMPEGTLSLPSHYEFPKLNLSCATSQRAPKGTTINHLGGVAWCKSKKRKKDRRYGEKKNEQRVPEKNCNREGEKKNNVRPMANCPVA